jgi:hypothetical protein
MSDELDFWNFADKDDAKAEIRAAVEYLLGDATGGARGDIVQEILAIVRDAANGLPAREPSLQFLKTDGAPILSLPGLPEEARKPAAKPA